MTLEFRTLEWIDGQPVVRDMTAEEISEFTASATDLAAWRAAAKCSRLQGRLTLGADVCAALDAMAADPATPWAMRETINSAMEWRRTSQTIDELGYLLGYTDAQMDAMFEAAMLIAV
jgi:hypothetical protein